MNRALYIIGIVFSFIFLIVIGYYIEEVSSARLSYLFSSFDFDYGYGSSYNSYGSSSEYKDLTVNGAIWSALFILAFVGIQLVGLIKVKTKTIKVLSIVGLALSAIFLFWSLGVMASPGSMSYDEVGGGFGLYALIMMAFSIVGLIQSVRFLKREMQPAVSKSEDLLDA